MKVKALVAVVAMAFLCMSVTALAANTGKLQVKIVNQDGVSINGTVTAKKDSTVKTCNTSAGVCTMSNLAPGTWLVTVKVGTKKGGPKTKSVANGSTAKLTVQVNTATTSR